VIPDDLLRPFLEHRFQLPSDLGRVAKGSGQHPVTIGPEPERARTMLPRPSLLRVLHRRSRRNIRVLQRNEALLGDVQQMRFRVPVERRRRRNERSLLRRHRSGPNRRRTEFNVLRAVSSEANMCSYRIRWQRRAAKKRAYF
jgi:hypothetical protein